MVPGRSFAADFGICDAGTDYLFLRGRGLHSSAGLPFDRYLIKYSTANIHNLFGVITSVSAQMAQGYLYGSRCLKTGHDRES